MTGTNPMESDCTSSSGNVSLVKCSLKWGASLVLVAFLIARTDFQPLTASIADYGFNLFRLSLGFLFCSFSVFLTLVRWKTLLSAFGVSAETSEVRRIGLFSYALNLLALGSLGGDFGRAVLISRQYPSRRRDVMLSVGLDRIIGLYAMFVIAFVFAVTENLFVSENLNVRCVAWLTAAGTLLMPAGFACLSRMIHVLNPQNSATGLRRKITDLISACQGQLLTRSAFQAFLISLILRTTTAVGIYFLGTSLIGNGPGLRMHMLAASVGLLTGCLPLPFNGLGALEAVLEFAFQTLPATPCPPGYGIAVALIYRTFLLAVGVLGAIGFNWQPAKAEPQKSRPTPRFDSSVVLVSHLAE